MADKPVGYGEGMKKARLHTGMRLNRVVSQELMAQLVSAELKRMGSDKTVSQSAWSDYEAETSEPAFAIVRATSRVCGLPESEIAFPAGSGAEELRYMTVDDLKRAARVAETTRSGREGGKGGRRRPA